MKIKTFILTFLMMMSCPFLFGLSHFNPDTPTGFELEKTITAKVVLDGTTLTDASYEIATYVGDVCDEVQTIGAETDLPDGMDVVYYVSFGVHGDNTTGDIHFRLWDGEKEYVSLNKLPFNGDDWTEDELGSLGNLYEINFKSVAQIEGDEFDVVYPSLQEAIDAAKNGDEITLLQDNAENVTVVQAPDVAFTINGDNKTMIGTITVNGKSQAYATAGLTIKNVNFDARNIAKDASINLGVSSNTNTRYTNGVTVENCNFTGDWNTTGEEKSAIKNYTGGCKNLTVTGGTFTGLHSLMQVKGVDGIAVSDVTVSDCKNGISVGGTSTNVAISGSTISATGYGVRADGEGAYTMTLTNNSISAELPVVVRNVKEVAYNLTIAGDNNNFTALKQGTNTEGYQVVFTTGDDGTYVAPTTGQFVLTAPENFNVYPVYVAKIGDLKYPSLEAALNAVTENCTVEILTDITIDYLWDCRYTGAQLSVPVTIDGNENTIYFTGEIKDNNWNTLFRFENVATVKNLTLDASTATGIERGISTKLSVTVENCTLIGNGSTAKRAVIVGESAGAGNIGNVTATIKRSTFRNWTHGVSDNQNAQDMKEIAIENCVFDNANVLISAKENVTFTGNNMSENSYVNISSYTVPNEVKVVATGNENLAANTDTKYNQINAKLENITAQEGFLTPVAEINGKNYFSLQAAINAATEGQTVKVIANVELENTVTVAAGKVVTLDLNGNVVSGVCNTSSGYLFMVQNTAELTVKDSSENQEGKISYARGTSSTGWAINLEGKLVLESGTIELTGEGWDIAYVVDIRPNSWGLEYTEATTFTMNGGKLVSDYDAIRIASTSADGSQDSGAVHENVSANFVMNGGEIVSNRDAIFVQQSNKIYDILNLQVNDGKISGAQSLIRLYGPAATSVVNNVENPITLDLNGGIFDYTGNNLEDTRWLVPGVIMVAGGATFDEMLDYTNFEITGGTFDGDVNAYCAFGYTCQANGDGTYSVVETEGFEIPNLDRLIAFRNAVNAGNNFKGQTVTVTDDIDLASVENWTPIGTSAHSFQGTFDGGNFTISNLKAEGETYVGLFGNATSATIKNVKIENADVKGKSMVGAIVGNLHSSTMDNCHVTGLVQIEGNYKVGGLVGTAYSSVRNSSLVAANNSYVKGTHLEANFEGDNVGGITGYNGEGVYTYSNNTVKNVTISGTRKVGGILGFIFEVAKVEGSVVENVTIESTATSEYAQENAGKMSIGGIIGQYQTYSSNNGYVNSSVVKNVTFVKGENLDFQVGPLVGGTRNNPGFAPSATVTSKDNLVYMSTITGSNNLFLMHAVAQIDETEYYTLDEAIAAANNQTVIVLENVTLRNTLTIETGKTVTLDLNGKTINYNPEVWTYGAANSGTALLTVAFGGNLTIEDNSAEQTGTIDASYTEEDWDNYKYDVYGAVMMTAAGDNAENGIAKLTVNGGTLKGFFAAVAGNRNRDNTEITINGGHLTAAISDKFSTTGIEHPMNGRLTINGGTIDGMDGISFRSGTLLITNGIIIGNAPTTAFEEEGYWDNNFAACTGHALQIVNRANNEPTNETPNVTISGGEFTSLNTTAVGSYASVNGATPDTKIVNFIEGGTFSSDPTEYLKQGYVAKQNNDGKYVVSLGVAKIEETGAIYGTLAEAVNAATTSQNITLLADIDETFTITKKVTIDGGGHNSKGTISTKANTTFTFRNFNVNGNSGYFLKPNGGGGNYIIENCTIKNCYYGFLYINSSTNNVTIKNVTIEGCNGINAVSVNNITLENVTMTNVTDGVYISNAGTRTVTFKNCNINATNPTSLRNQGTGIITFKFEGETNINGKELAVNEYFKYVLSAEGAKLIGAQEGLAVSTTVKDCVVEYEEGETAGFGTYSVIAANVALYRGEDLVKKFATIQDAIDAAQDGDVVRVLENVDLNTNEFVTLDGKYNTYFKVEGKTVTIDLNGKTISGEYAITSPLLVGVFSTENGGHLTLEDNVGTAKVELEGVDGEVYALIANYEGGCSITINGGTYILDDANSSGALVWSSPSANDGEGIRVYGGNFHLGNVGTLVNGSPWIFNVNGQDEGHIKVFGGTYNDNVFGQHWTFEVQTTREYAIKYDGDDEAGTWTVVPAVAWVNNRIKTDKYYTYELGYVTLAEAFAAAADCDEPDFTETVTLLQNITLEEGITVNAGEEVILDLNGFTVSQEKECTKHYEMIRNNGTFTIKDSTEDAQGKISFKDISAGDPNFGWGSYTIGNYGTLVVENGTIENISTQNPGSGQPNVHMYCAIQQGHGAVSTTINGGTISNQTYRSIRTNTGALVINGGNIIGQVWVQPNQGNATLEITDGTFTPTGNDGSSVFMTNEGENYTVTSASITGGFFNTKIGATNPNREGVAGCVTGGTFTTDAKDNTVAALINENFAFVDNGDGTWTVMPCQEQHLVAGWNWYSTYLDIKTADLTNAIGSNGTEIKNQDGGKTYYVSQLNKWSGSLDIDFSKMYMINVNEACSLQVASSIVNAEEYTINLRTGWSWIGYPSDQEVDINTALANIPEPKDGDRIKSQYNGFAEYIWGSWRGSLKTLVPGIGYMYNNKSGEVKEFKYNFATTTRGAVEANVTAENNYWTPNTTTYPFNMTMTAVVDGLANGNYEVAAFVNGEVRGSARPIYIEEIDSYVLFLTIHGDDVEEMSFRLYDIDTDTEYDLSDRINYSNNAEVGSLDNPYTFTRGTTGIGEAAMSNINIYPNPTTIGTEINLEATCDKVEVFNALGVKVVEYQNVDSIDALETAGIYVIRITNNGNVQNCRLVVK